MPTQPLTTLIQCILSFPTATFLADFITVPVLSCIDLACFPHKIRIKFHLTTLSTSFWEEIEPQILMLARLHAIEA